MAGVHGAAGPEGTGAGGTTGSLTGKSTMYQNANPLVRLRLDPPEPFDGQTTSFEKFSKKLKSYLSMTDKRLGKLMEWSSKQTTPISLEDASLQIKETVTGEEGTSLGDTEMC